VRNSAIIIIIIIINTSVDFVKVHRLNAQGLIEKPVRGTVLYYHGFRAALDSSL